MPRRLALIAPILVVAVGLIVVLYAIDRRPGPPGGRIDRPAPELDLEGLDPLNPGLATHDLRQGSVTLVNLFASWCLPCRVEAPQLQALADRGVTIHGVAVRDEPSAVASFLRRYGDPFRRVGLDPQGRAPEAFGAAGLPETYIVDGEGRVRYRHVGDIRPEDVPKIMAEIARLRG